VGKAYVFADCTKQIRGDAQLIPLELPARIERFSWGETPVHFFLTGPPARD
jgi:hypothetical protein